MGYNHIKRINTYFVEISNRDGNLILILLSDKKELSGGMENFYKQRFNLNNLQKLKKKGLRRKPYVLTLYVA